VFFNTTHPIENAPYTSKKFNSSSRCTSEKGAEGFNVSISNFSRFDVGFSQP